MKQSRAVPNSLAAVFLRVLSSYRVSHVKPAPTNLYLTSEWGRFYVGHPVEQCYTLCSCLNWPTHLLHQTYLLTPWHYSPDGRKPPLIRSVAWFSVFEEQVANLLPQHLFESAWLNNQSHLVAKQENITGEKRVRKFGRQSISLMLCRVIHNCSSHVRSCVCQVQQAVQIAFVRVSTSPHVQTSVRPSVLWPKQPSGQTNWSSSCTLYLHFCRCPAPNLTTFTQRRLSS
jgi:hypothetical protein